MKIQSQDRAAAAPLRLVAEGLRHAYQPDQIPVVDIERLVVEPGATVALTGPSGSGKTTLACLLTGIRRAHSRAQGGRPLARGAAAGRFGPRLLRRPPILMADEPTASLDAGSGARVIELLVQAVRESGATLLAVTHDPALIAAMDAVHHLEHGRLERRR
jgi:ABC-type lipoprotein export system ATPase subunit